MAADEVESATGAIFVSDEVRDAVVTASDGQRRIHRRTKEESENVKTIHIALLAIVATTLPLTGFAADEQSLSTAIVATGKSLALHGFDPVAYFTL
jgi:hypothetical protein